MFGPKAKVDDDLLDILVVANIPKLKALLLIPFALMGWHIYFKGAYTYTCRHVAIHAENALPVHTDGEPIFLQHDVTMSCIPQRLRVIVPNS